MVLAAETPGLAAVAGCEARRQRNCPTRAPAPPQLWGIYGTLDKPSGLKRRRRTGEPVRGGPGGAHTCLGVKLHALDTHVVVQDRRHLLEVGLEEVGDELHRLALLARLLRARRQHDVLRLHRLHGASTACNVGEPWDRVLVVTCGHRGYPCSHTYSQGRCRVDVACNAML